MEAENKEEQPPGLLSLQPELIAYLCAFVPTQNLARLEIALAGPDIWKTRFRLAVGDYFEALLKRLDWRGIFGDGQSTRSSEKLETALRWHLNRLARLEHLDIAMESEDDEDTLDLERAGLLPKTFCLHADAGMGKASLTLVGVDGTSSPIPRSFMALKTISIGPAHCLNPHYFLAFALNKHVRGIFPKMEELDITRYKRGEILQLLATVTGAWDAATALARQHDPLAQRDTAAGLPESERNNFNNPDPNFEWTAPEVFPFHLDFGKPEPENMWQGAYSSARVVVRQMSYQDGLKLLREAAEAQDKYGADVVLAWKNPECLKPISVRFLPRWFSQDWHCVDHPGIAAGERHWYRPDGTFMFSRSGQAIGFVNAFGVREDAGLDGVFELSIKYSDWPPEFPQHIQNWAGSVAIKEVPEGSADYGHVMSRFSWTVESLLSRDKFLDGRGKTNDAERAKRRIRVMRSAQGTGFSDGFPAVFPVLGETSPDVSTGIWIAVDYRED